MSSPKTAADQPTLDEGGMKPPPTPKVAVWIGRVLSVLVVATLGMSAYMKYAQPPEAVEGFQHLGYPMRVAIPLAIVELSCAVIYLIPQTAVLGAILIAAYLGGATATHVRVGDSPVAPIVVGVLAWLGLLLRDRRLWSLLPIRRL